KGSILKQNHGVIGYYSRKLTQSEQNYSIVEKEFFSIVAAIEHLRKIILGCKVIVHTDNANIVNFKKIENNRISRWKWHLNEFNLEIMHISGENNVIADKLSRLNRISIEPIDTSETRIHELIQSIKTATSEFKKESMIEMLHEQLGHPGIQGLTSFLRTSLNDPHYKIVKKTIKNCEICATNKHYNRALYETHGSLTTEQPNKRVSTDICGPFN
ncbi:LTR transposable element, partial [Pseudoloma neurophilia]